MKQKILDLKKQLGDKVIIPAHHYQSEEIVEIADIVGDSYKLAVDVSKSDAQYIVFCGVRFMAEGAAILAGEHQKIVLPAVNAGCPMADMITIQQAEKAHQAIKSYSGRTAVPVIYMNAYGDIKAFCGTHDGAICTSSNAKRIITHFLNQGKPIFFGPDYCLGINTAKQLGIPDEHIAVVSQDCSISSAGKPEDIQLYLWSGNCRVHQRFTEQHLQRLREEVPGIRIIVHPEVKEHVAALADESGSTQYIYNRIRDAEPGTIWGVGTEYNFVKRITREFPDREIHPLFESRCLNMEKTTMENLLDALTAIAEDRLEETIPDAVITVDDAVRQDASKALNRMISIVENSQS